jgi:quinol monooxygenase YgiN
MKNALRIVLIAAVAFLATACCGQKQQTQQEPKMIRLNVTVTIDPASQAEVTEALNLLAAASRAEEGCRGYEIYQNTIRPEQMLIVETWQNQAALDAHQQTTHYTTILPPLADKMQMSLDRFEF